MRTALRRRLLVLCYHAVIPDDFPTDSYRTRGATRASDFRRQLETAARLFHHVSAYDVLSHVIDGNPLPSKPILITFDDGFRNNLTVAAPIMERLGIPAIIHITTGHIGREDLLWPQELDERIISWKHAWLPMPQDQPDTRLPADQEGRWSLVDQIRDLCKRLPQCDRIHYLHRLRDAQLSPLEDWRRELYGFLSWDEVRELDRRGIAIGSHTVTHPILASLARHELIRELHDSKAQIESELNKPCPWIAYPNGGVADFSPTVVAEAREAGYKIAFTLTEMRNARSLDAMTISRICIPGQLSDNGFHARANGLLSYLARHW
jgi:peptidoglycan/xylan/chitin deacetylase (PgdA/CDA1 family)